MAALDDRGASFEAVLAASACDSITLKGGLINEPKSFIEQPGRSAAKLVLNRGTWSDGRERTTQVRPTPREIKFPFTYTTVERLRRTFASIRSKLDSKRVAGPARMCFVPAGCAETLRPRPNGEWTATACACGGARRSGPSRGASWQDGLRPAPAGNQAVSLPGTEVQKAAYSHVVLGRTVLAQFRPRRDTDFTAFFPLARGVSTLPSSSARR
jgi:hypothetical protein